ncbi:MAG: hypothetical protein Sylvanvirus27_10 [Sylvanvirus sp.]|uniref:2OGFeDO JBP1/TET oxygenase domain-containing protein n=1 Tax=Sylvanvirus sp. TaxID=2487774 RepID=A0A3G5AIZ8_9VIRU|nr:MAG: hypothetical protein Sylvanvirus27_10 [Sylvanvirus sp.]
MSTSYASSDLVPNPAYFIPQQIIQHILPSPVYETISSEISSIPSVNGSCLPSSTQASTPSISFSTIHATAVLNDKEVQDLESEYMDSAGIVWNENVDVYDKDDGHLICKFRKNVLQYGHLAKDYLHFKQISKNRSAAAGKTDAKYYPHGFQPINKYQSFPLNAKGVKTSYMYSNPVFNGTYGFYESSSRHKECRQTSLTQKHKNQFKRALPLISEVDEWYKVLYEEAHTKQKEAIQFVPNYVIGKTAFTTISVNTTVRTAIHCDAGDLKTSCGAYSPIIAQGEWEGGELCFPKYNMAFNLRPGDMLLASVHDYHCNLLFTSSPAETSRISIVFFARENIPIRCSDTYQRGENIRGMKGMKGVRTIRSLKRTYSDTSNTLKTSRNKPIKRRKKSHDDSSDGLTDELTDDLTDNITDESSDGYESSIDSSEGYDVDDVVEEGVIEEEKEDNEKEYEDIEGTEVIDKDAETHIWAQLLISECSYWFEGIDHLATRAIEWCDDQSSERSTGKSVFKRSRRFWNRSVAKYFYEYGECKPLLEQALKVRGYELDTVMTRRKISAVAKRLDTSSLPVSSSSSSSSVMSTYKDRPLSDISSVPVPVEKPPCEFLFSSSSSSFIPSSVPSPIIPPTNPSINSTSFLSGISQIEMFLSVWKVEYTEMEKKHKAQLDDFRKKMEDQEVVHNKHINTLKQELQDTKNKYDKVVEIFQSTKSLLSSVAI